MSMGEPVIIMEPLAVKRITAARMLDCGATKIHHLISSGKLKTIKVGEDLRVTVASIKQFVESGGDI
jgi:excisionase family DNA binding protein